MHTLLYRRQCFDVNCVYKLLNNIINCPDILNLIPIDVSKVTLRSYPMFYISIYAQNYSSNSPLNSILNLCNEINNLYIYIIKMLFFQCTKFAL